jgi:DNA-binding NarL/FixJ family response regulator
MATDFVRSISVTATRHSNAAARTIRSMPTTILIVDDHPEFRRSARSLLSAEGFEVVGDAVDGVGALAAARLLRPQVVLLDVQLPDLDGFEVAEAMAARDPSLSIILISSRDVAAYSPQLEGAPVRGFIPKSRLDGASIRELMG